MKKTDFRKILATFFAVFSCAYLAAITFLPIQEGSSDYVQVILGFVLGTAISTLIGYYFGSSE